MNDTQPLCIHCNKYMFNPLDIQRGEHFYCEINARKISNIPSKLPFVTNVYFNPDYSEMVFCYDLSIETESATLTFKTREMYEQCLKEEGLVFIGLLE